jgi:hypothetical protein
MLEMLLEFISDLFFIRWWRGDDGDDTPWWAIALLIVVALAVAGFVGASAGAW